MSLGLSFLIGDFLLVIGDLWLIITSKTNLTYFPVETAETHAFVQQIESKETNGYFSHFLKWRKLYYL